MDASTNVQSDTGVPTGAPPYRRSIVLTRTFDAPRALMWKMWTDPVHLAQWFGPQLFINHTVSVELRVGGAMKLTMRGPQGSEHPMIAVFREITAPERLVFTNNAVDERGGLLLEGMTTVSFAEVGGKTKVTLETTATGTAEITKFMLGGMKDGWTQSFDKLAAYLPSADDDVTFTLTRTFDAPRALVWNAWTEAEALVHWWGPKGFKMKSVKLDLRAGGTFHYGMETPQGQTMWGIFVFREIVKPERIVWVNSFADEKGGITRHPMAADWPLEMLNTVTLSEDGDKTVLALRSVPVNATDKERAVFREGHKSMQGGFTGTLNQLEAYLAEGAAARTIVISRLFDAPRELVWKVMTTPEHMVHTHTPAGWTTFFDEVDLRPGGNCRWRMRTPDGQEMHMHFVYREVVPFERIVHTEARQEGNPYKPGSTGILTFEAKGGKTLLTLRFVFGTVADRERLAQMGFAGPIAQSLELAAVYIAKLQGG